MMKKMVSLLVLSLLAAGCEDGAPERTTTSVQAANTVSDQLKGMSELYRNLGLRRAIMDTGNRCKKVDRGGYQEQYKTMALWTAHCTDTGDWAIFIAPNADIQVRQCRHMAELKLPACRPIAAPAAEAKPAPKA
ncbi:hypothetical protein [Sphingosinicella sp. BN140058]|uniref:hypothetical protein n=1 Tax=Sphingosinicella sp. BN140058 TaxID=1892855 RepID=UPI0010100C67|nr:hypothetical protein [Sphingosinicella sp. BN140058]QAY77730.1 hypothetical protein ETR14_15320 [Sphingosinicella sp. BN140058]